ncbi:NAD(P)-dependent oxidoreductase [Luteolibacter sp. GHJ8]|uniref:NAD(P)-dependent oxidoreductase n=1 Tax=Luteolibacter rhizosphaerae TaxID=2989719 RepID=A0ABT3G9P6_9BACT|nr:NAD(P)-dependent oxidoreductase [Luteolibacter rhizosphaerae]MCW1916578.1 NAD(P)-dependent oxidoreductase [Luteolibacter rhizosphaerae]
MKRIFIAGASGAVGRRLCPMLVADGYEVTGMTRSPDKVPMLHELGVQPVVADAFDQAALDKALLDVRPEIVIHQLTELPRALAAEQMTEARVRTARIREIGTRNLIAASVAAGAKRLIAQSIAFAYAPGEPPYDECASLNLDDTVFAVSVRGVVSLEQQVLGAPLTGIVLRYGKFYGPGTGFDHPAAGGPVHVDDAARAACLAIARGERGIYNIAEEDGIISSRKAREELGWVPGFRLPGSA